MKYDNLKLIAEAQNGNGDALSALCRENAGLVHAVARRFSGRGTDYEDLCQIGQIGMIKAIKNFDLERGTQFSTYAVPLIIGEIRRFLRDDGSIKIGREIKRKGRLLLSEASKFAAVNGREPSVSELAGICGMTVEEAADYLGATSETISLSEAVGDVTLEDRLGKDFTPEINEKIALKQAIEKLEFEEKEIITLRYFKNLTQAETGRVLGMSQVTVSRREARALSKLKEDLT